MALFKARHRRRVSIGLISGLRTIGSISTLLLLLGLAIQWLVPEQWVEWHTETRLTEILERPVDLEVGALRMFPLPHVAAERLQLGDANDRLLSGQAVRLYLDPLGLLQGRPFRRVAMERGKLDLEALLKAPGIIERLARAGFNNLEIERLGGDDAATEPTALSVSGMPAERWLAQLKRAEQTLSIRGKRTGNWTALDVEAAAWSLPAPHSITLSSLKSSARLAENQLDIERFAVRLGDGQAHITLHLEQQQEWQIKGSATLEQIPLEPLLERVALPILSGKANGTLLVSGSAPRLGELASALGLSGELEVMAGQLRGIDLPTPAERLSVGDFGGESTPFDLMHLQLKRDAEGWLADITRLESVALTASGALRILPGGSLQGLMEVLLKQSGAAQVPILIAGTARSPQTRLDPEALLAADAGRALLGEEKGGSVGIRAGKALENLSDWWGTKDEASEEPPVPVLPAEKDDTPWILDYD